MIANAARNFDPSESAMTAVDDDSRPTFDRVLALFESPPDTKPFDPAHVLLLTRLQRASKAHYTAILDGLLMRYIESQVYRAAVENVASEMAARMIAMGAASDNAGKLIGELQLIYNKARQAAITKELSEIVGVAAAV